MGYITEVVVTTHEKRSHPYEFGHADASVTLTVTVEPNESAADIIDAALLTCRNHCYENLDEWLGDIEHEREQERLLIRVRSKLQRLENWRELSPDKLLEFCNKLEESILEITDPDERMKALVRFESGLSAANEKIFAAIISEGDDDEEE